MNRPEIIEILAREPQLSPLQQRLLTEQLSCVDNESNERVFDTLRRDLRHFRLQVLDATRLDPDSVHEDVDSLHTLFDALESRLNQLESA